MISRQSTARSKFLIRSCPHRLDKRWQASKVGESCETFVRRTIEPCRKSSVRSTTSVKADHPLNGAMHPLRVELTHRRRQERARERASPLALVDLRLPSVARNALEPRFRASVRPTCSSADQCASSPDAPTSRRFSISLVMASSKRLSTAVIEVRRAPRRAGTRRTTGTHEEDPDLSSSIADGAGWRVDRSLQPDTSIPVACPAGRCARLSGADLHGASIRGSASSPKGRLQQRAGPRS